MTIVDNIKTYRKQNKLTQKELGDLINKSTISIRKYEANDITPSISVLNDIASALNITINDLTNQNNHGLYGTVRSHQLRSATITNNTTAIEKNIKSIVYNLNDNNENNAEKTTNDLTYDKLVLYKIKIEELEREVKYLKEMNSAKDETIKRLQDINQKAFSLLGGGTDGE